MTEDYLVNHKMTESGWRINRTEIGGNVNNMSKILPWRHHMKFPLRHFYFFPFCFQYRISLVIFQSAHPDHTATTAKMAARRVRHVRPSPRLTSGPGSSRSVSVVKATLQTPVECAKVRSLMTRTREWFSLANGPNLIMNHSGGLFATYEEVRFQLRERCG